MRTFPLEFRRKKPLRFYPTEPKGFDADFLEIGPGNGEFLIRLAETYPDRRILALELDRSRFNKIVKRLNKREIDNVALICGDARVAIPQLLTNCRFERIYVLFPDPWPKRKHAPHRLMTIEFLEMLSGLLENNGSLFFASDVRPYADLVARNVAEVQSLTIDGEPFCTADQIRDYEATFFERLARDEGAKVSYLVAHRIVR